MLHFFRIIFSLFSYFFDLVLLETTRKKALRNPILAWPHGHKVHDLTGHISLLGLTDH